MLCLAMLAGLFAHGVRAADVLTVTKTSHPLDAYAIDVLQLALDHMDKKYTLKVLEETVTQSRAIEDVKSGRTDVYWFASSKQADELLLPIRIPIIKGLLGHRILIIRPDMQKIFDQVKTFDDLKQFSYGQGTNWPDTEVLRNNGLNLVVTTKYTSLFYMIEGGRFDGFPRGVIEPWAELRTHSQLNLTVEKNIVLVYKQPFYLAVSENNQALARELHRALDAALADGSFDKLFYKNNLVKDALNRSNLKNRKVFHLHNPNLSKQTPLDRDEYWLDLEKLKDASE